jgi:hypothetical protein
MAYSSLLDRPARLPNTHGGLPPGVILEMMWMLRDELENKRKLRVALVDLRHDETLDCEFYEISVLDEARDPYGTLVSFIDDFREKLKEAGVW